MSHVEVLATGIEIAFKGPFGGRSRDQKLLKLINQEHTAAI